MRLFKYLLEENSVARYNFIPCLEKTMITAMSNFTQYCKTIDINNSNIYKRVSVSPDG